MAYKVTGDLKKLLGPKPCFFLPDDRTIVFDEEPVIRQFVSGKQPELPAFLRSPAWERPAAGLVAFAIKNLDDSFAKDYDLSRPDDAVVLSLFKEVDWWLLGVDDEADPIVLHAEAACRNRDASEAVSRAESLIAMGRQTIDQELQHDQPEDPQRRTHRSHGQGPDGGPPRRAYRAASRFKLKASARSPTSPRSSRARSRRRKPGSRPERCQTR